jgi:hypothetical protein
VVNKVIYFFSNNYFILLCLNNFCLAYDKVKWNKCDTCLLRKSFKQGSEGYDKDGEIGLKN